MDCEGDMIALSASIWTVVRRLSRHTVPRILLEQSFNGLELQPPIWIWHCLQDPLPVLPDGIFLGVSSQTLGSQVKILLKGSLNGGWLAVEARKQSSEQFSSQR